MSLRIGSSSSPGLIDLSGSLGLDANDVFDCTHKHGMDVCLLISNKLRYGFRLAFRIFEQIVAMNRIMSDMITDATFVCSRD